MKKLIITLLCIILLLLSACAGSNQADINIPEDSNASNAMLEQENNNKNQTNSITEKISNTVIPTPEPTQEFINDDANQPTAYVQPTSNLKHEDILGLYYLVYWLTDNIDVDLVFYEITLNMMNIMPYGNAPVNADYNYTYNNGVMELGSDKYDVVLDNGVLVLTSPTTGYRIILQPVTEQDIPLIIATNDTSGSTSNAADVSNKPNGSERTGYPHLDNEIVVEFYDHESIAGILVGSTWHTYGYMYDDGTIVHGFTEDAKFYFNQDYSFTLDSTFGPYNGLYELINTELNIFYDDGTIEYHSSTFIVLNEDTGWYYLYISDETPGYEACYTVYEGKHN